MEALAMNRNLTETAVVYGPVTGALPTRKLPGVGPGLPAAEALREFLRPDYAGRFRCTASACEDTCCQGWGVPIDQATYEKYRSSPEMRPFVGTLVVLNTNAPTTRDYARIASTPTGACGFLDADRMCGIQKRMGEAMLSTTCAVYPRAVSTRGGVVEKALNLSCPEAARLVLLDGDLLGMDEPSLRGPGRHYLPFWDARGAVRGRADAAAVREFSVLLLRDRSYPLWQRVYLLGTLVRRLDAARGTEPADVWCERNAAALGGLLAEHARLAATGRMRLAMEEIAAEPGLQLELTAELLRLRMAGPPVPQRFLECLECFEVGMRFATATSEQELLGGYDAGRRAFFEPLLNSQPALLENYLINHIFKNNFPFGARSGGGPVDVEAELIQLALHAMLVRTLLIGIARHFGADFAAAHAVKLVQSLARAVEHNREFLDMGGAVGRERGLVSARVAASLLR
jgi:lysine-N-methylase